MKIHKRTRDKIARLSKVIIEDFDWIQENGDNWEIDYDLRTFVRKKLEKNEDELLKITDRFTPEELMEQIDDENFQALNCAGDFGNTELER